jgi:hypothetical protein
MAIVNTTVVVTFIRVLTLFYLCLMHNPLPVTEIGRKGHLVIIWGLNWINVKIYINSRSASGVTSLIEVSKSCSSSCFGNYWPSPESTANTIKKLLYICCGLSIGCYYIIIKGLTVVVEIKNT